jgi:hypothetical protein
MEGGMMAEMEILRISVLAIFLNKIVQFLIISAYCDALLTLKA